jgi:hypothetical protein
MFVLSHFNTVTVYYEHKVQKAWDFKRTIFILSKEKFCLIFWACLLCIDNLRYV